MDIEVGEYVRTPEEGFIGKLVEINKGVLNYYKIDVGREIRRPDGYSDNYIYSRDGFGLKHSKNIINLIQVGDILELDGNKYEVIYDESYDKLGVLIPHRDKLAIRHSAVKGIFAKNGFFKKVSILTHEQYESNCYRLED